MSIQLIKIIIGAVLTLSVGFLVFVTKKPVFISNEIISMETVVSGEKQTVVIKNISAKNKFFDDEDDEYENGDGRGGIAIANSNANNSAQSVITLVQISQHNSRASCWSVINGGVYDLTSWIPNHPGGEKTILSICGSDGSSGYNSQHGGKSKITAILAGFKIGTLVR